MKKIVLVCLAAATLAAMAAYTINGSYNSTFGYLTGQEASGNYVSAFGAGAAGYSTGATRSTFVGAASGVGAHSPVDCVGLGYRTLRGSTGCDGCVAIGARTMTDSTNCYNCVCVGRQRDDEAWSDRSDMTWINGQIIAYPGRLAINPSPLAETDESEDPATKDLHYYSTDAKPPVIEMTEVATTNGEYRTRLCLNADEVVITNGVVEYLQARVAHAASADNSMYAEAAGHAQDAGSADFAENAVYAERAVRAEYLNSRAGDPELTAEDVLAMFASATNRIAALEAALHSVTNNLSGGN